MQLLNAHFLWYCSPQNKHLQKKMSKTIFLDLHNNISKQKYLRKPSRMFSCEDRENSGLSSAFQPNMDELRCIFDKFDCDRDGKISQGEYKAILRALGNGSTNRDVQKIFDVADMNGDGFIDFKEYVEVQKKGGGVTTVNIQTAFRAFDLDGDGKISVEELYELLKRLGERCSLQDCRNMVRAVDSDGDGAIDMNEFTTMMTNTI